MLPTRLCFCLRHFFPTLSVTSTLALALTVFPSLCIYFRTPTIFHSYLPFFFNLILFNSLFRVGFPVVRTSAATGRHFTIVAVKGGSNDVRPSAELRAKSDSHLNTLDIKAPKKV